MTRGDTYSASIASGGLISDRPRTVLLVDDNVSVRESLARLLRMEGYDVVEAADGLEALERLDAVRPDVVVTDLRMPRMHGLDLIRESRRRLEGAQRIVAISVHGPEALASARDAGADALVDKLADFDDLLAAIESR
jgi:CheY-like chemotaxis protein